MGPTQSHGFARNTEFTVIDGSDSFVTLCLSSSDDTRELWPHDFELTVRIEITGSGALLQEVRSFVGFRSYQRVAEFSGQCRWRCAVLCSTPRHTTWCAGTIP